MSGTQSAGRLWTVLALVAAVPLGAQAPKPAAKPSVAAMPVVTARSDVSNYQGSCPGRLTFTGTIRMPAGSKKQVTYQWIRSDKSKSARRTGTLQGDSLTVIDKWQGGAPGEMMRFWQELHVVAPVAAKSKQVEVGVLCR